MAVLLRFSDTLFVSLTTRRSIETRMYSAKEESFSPQSDVYELSDVTPGDTSELLGDEWDRRGMVRIGKKQELRREFRFFSITGYAMILGCSWEFALM